MSKKKKIRELEYQIDKLECELIQMKRTFENKKVEAEGLRLRCNAAEREALKQLRSANNAVQEQMQMEEEITAERRKSSALKEQLKKMHKLKADNIAWKRTANHYAMEAQRHASNVKAVMSTYESSEKQNVELASALREALGKLEVYERCMGKLEQEQQA